MSLLRRYYHHQFRHHQRFHVAVVLTIVAVSYAIVPAVVRFVESLATYNPIRYEPKDVERGAWLERKIPLGLADIAWDDLLKIALFILAGLAWLAVAPPAGSERRRR